MRACLSQRITLLVFYTFPGVRTISNLYGALPTLCLVFYEAPNMHNRSTEFPHARKSTRSSQLAKQRVETDWTERVEVNSAEEVVGQIGLVLVIALGSILMVNVLLIALHIG